MSIVPRTLVDKVQFYETHLPLFAANAATIGLSADEVDQLQAKAQAARDLFNAQQEAQQLAQARTLEFNNAVDSLGALGAALIKIIRAKAEMTANKEIYPLSGLPAPADGSPIEAPGTPGQLFTTLHAGDGSLLLKWSCKNPRGSVGTTYQIHRSVGTDNASAAGELVYLGVTGRREFVDQTIPANATRMQYQIQAIRSTKVGVAATFNVNFGSNGAKRSSVFVTSSGVRHAA